MAREIKRLEILSPAKNLFFGKEAIKCGADSLYIGAEKFSLRYEYGNSLKDIKELVEYAHRYWVRVYVPLNCLLYSEDDLSLAQKMINEFYEIGVDGIIIQDIGILELDLPPIPIILSTNTMCFTKEDVQFFEECGVSRIVLPRELSFPEIKEITENSDIEIETFCYGFLCVGHSGNCYLAYVEDLNKTKSSKISHYKASNHGVCPERCMGNWTLKDAEGNIIIQNDRLLNLRFLNWYDNIEKLVDVGINSFKIAGREKDLKHLKNSTALFSKKADEICKNKGLKRLSSGKCILDFEPNFSKNFNKGFTDFFFNGRKQEMYSKNHIVGTNIGKVSECLGKKFKIDSDLKLNIGDRLRYKKEAVISVEISDIAGEYYIAENLKEDITGLELYRYIDTAGFKEVETSENYRVISVSLNFKNGQVIARDEDNNEVELSISKGENIISAEELQNKLSQIDEEWEFIAEKVNSDGEIFYTSLDGIKEQIFSALRKERSKNRPKLKGRIIKNDIPYYKEKLSYLANVTNIKTKEFYQRHGVKEIETALENLEDLTEKKVFSSRYCLRNELGLCSKTKPNNLPPMPWKLEQLENGNKFTVEFDCKNCSMHLYLDKKENN